MSSSKSNRYKYANNGLYRWNNFAERAAQNSFPIFPIRSVGRTDGWYITIRVGPPTVAYPFIFSILKPKLKVRGFFKVLKKDGSSSFEWDFDYFLDADMGPKGCDMNILEILDEKNEYLNNGAILVEYGIQVESIFGLDKIWKFNFYDKIFDSEDKKNMVTFQHANDNSRLFYAHKQLFSIRNKNLYNSSNIIYYHEPSTRMEEFLQIAHGVQVQFSFELHKLTFVSYYDRRETLRIAWMFNFFNVIRYCERSFIQTSKDSFCMTTLEIAIDYNLNRLLESILRKYESLEHVAGVLKKLNIKHMSGESMKAFAGKIFSVEL